MDNDHSRKKLNFTLVWKILFMDYMNKMFHFLDKFVIVFIYNILIYSKNHDEHEEYLRSGLGILREK